MFAIEKDAFAFETLKTNLVDEGARHRYSWPEWLEQKPWTIESLMDSHRTQLSALRGRVDLLAGGPPCQGFSSAGRRRKGDPRNELVERYLEFVELLQPRMVLIENVRGITYDFVGDEASDRHNFADELVDRLSKSYHVYTDIIRCSAYGVPQKRPRFFLVGMLKSQFKKFSHGENPFSTLRSSKVKFLEKRGIRSTISCRQAISDFERKYAKVGPCPDTKGYEAIIPTPIEWLKLLPSMVLVSLLRRKLIITNSGMKSLNHVGMSSIPSKQINLSAPAFLKVFEIG